MLHHVGRDSTRAADFVVDEQQRVASMGIVNSREHIDSLFEAKERGVASIQDYMNKRAEAPYVEIKS